MLSSLCPVMAAILSVSRSLGPSGFLESSGHVRRRRQRFTLGFHAASWQHRYLNCGTLNLSGRCGGGVQPPRSAGCRQLGGVAGSAVAGRSRHWQAPAR
jgi:hypothetical protein